MEGLVCFRGGKLIDGTGKRPVENAVVVIKGNKIEATGNASEVSVPSDAEVIDAKGKVVMPGLIDAHVHLTGCTYPGKTVTEPMVWEIWKTPSEEMTLYAAIHARDSLYGGITTVRDLGGWAERRSLEVLAVKRMVNIGLLPGPRIIVGGVVEPSYGHFEKIFPPTSILPRPSRFYIDEFYADGPWEVRKRVRERCSDGVDCIKSSYMPGTAVYTPEEYNALVDESHILGRRVATHATFVSSEVMMNIINVGTDTIEHGTGTLSDEVIEAMIKKGAIMVSSLTALSPLVYKARVAMKTPEEFLQEIKKHAEVSFEEIKKASDAGVRIALGTDMYEKPPPAPMHGDNSYELEMMVEAGISEMKAIVSGTKVGAEALGLGDKIGTLEKGKLADVILVDGDPLKDIKILRDKSKILMVLKNGKIEVDRRKRLSA